MKANELRIGNYCKEITYSKNEVVKTSVEHFESIELGEINLSPIPLTEEWLLKFGFEKPAYSWIGDKFHLSEWDDYPFHWCVALNKNNAILVDKLNYVHQLQNLYFALTGEELTLKD